MSPSFIVVLLGAVASIAGTGVLAARCARTPRFFLVAWTIGMFGLAVALAAQSVGDLAGYSGTIFRAMELGGQALAPLALCLALTELIAQSVPARFAMRLAVGALAVIAAVILGTDPLNPNVTFSTAWPDPAVVYELIAKGVVEVLAVFTVITAVAAVSWIAWRSSRGLPAERVQPGLLGAVAAALLAVPGLLAAAHVSMLAKDVFAVACAGTAGLVLFAARAAAHRGLTEAMDETGALVPGHGGRGGRGDGYQTGDFTGPGGPRGRDDERYGRGERDPGYPDDADGRRPAGTGRMRDGDDYGYPGLAALAADEAGLEDRSRQLGGPGHYGDSGEFDSAQFDSAQFDSAQFDSAQFDSAQFESAEFDGREARPFGQITIYTLLEDGTADFDRLTERVVERVRASEPGTLAYIVHAVPTAPLQRILYEVYRGRGAYQDHQAMPYVAQYEADRRRLVLAANVIELGLQQGTVAPFPTFSAISDILSESGIDLTGVTRSPQRGGVAREPQRSPRASLPAPVADHPAGRNGNREGSYPPGGYPTENHRASGPRRRDGQQPPEGYPQADRYPQARGYPQPGGYPEAGGGGYPPPGGYAEPGARRERGDYPRPPGGRPSAPGGYPPGPGGQPPPSAGYPPPDGYPPPHDGYPPAPGGRSPSQWPEEPAAGGHPYGPPEPQRGDSHHAGPPYDDDGYDDEPGYDESGYQGWAELRRDDPRYR
jgi:quinol monooxygenase YgiN